MCRKRDVDYSTIASDFRLNNFTETIQRITNERDTIRTILNCEMFPTVPQDSSLVNVAVQIHNNRPFYVSS